MRIKVIACDALRREICAAAERSRHRTELEFLPTGHPDGTELLTLVQQAVDRAAKAPVDAIVVAYALCGSGVAGLESRTTPLVIPRLCDCLGFRDGAGGVCFRSTGWTPAKGKQWRGAYRQVTYLTTDAEGGSAQQRATFEFHAARGDLRIFDRLLNGDWNESDTLVVPPGWRVRESDAGLDREPIA